MLQALVNQEAKKPETKRNDIQGNKLNKNQDCNSQFHGKLEFLLGNHWTRMVYTQLEQLGVYWEGKLPFTQAVLLWSTITGLEWWNGMVK